MAGLHTSLRAVIRRPTVVASWLAVLLAATSLVVLAVHSDGVAIKKNGRYRTNPTINRNVIRMLASGKTARRAQGFLKYTVGRPSLPYVRYAAQHDSNSAVRRQSAWLARNL